MLVYQALLSLIALVFGSLTGVLVKRVPEGKDFGFARSQCPHCDYQLKWYENIPIVSYVILLAKCSNCKEKISSFYPLVEIGFFVCAFPFIKIAVSRFSAFSGFFDQVFIFADFLFYMAFIALALALGLIDQKKKELPHVLTYAGMVLGIIYVSLFASPYYSASESLSFLPGFLQSSFNAIKQFAVIVFSLDLLVFFANLIIFRENALLESSNALTFGQKKLQENTKLVYLIYFIIALGLVYFGQNLLLEIFFVVIGVSYLFFEILPFFLDCFAIGAYARTADEETENKKTILGGGDIMMLGFFATLLGFKKAFLVFLTSFYFAFIFLLLKIIKEYFDYQIQLSKNPEQDKSFDLLAILKGNIPLGFALALSFIAVMMMLAK